MLLKSFSKRKESYIKNALLFILDFNPAFIAAEIEEVIYKMFKEPNVKYKNRIKSRVMNLRDKRNSNLKKLIIAGDVSAERFAKMTSEVRFLECWNLKNVFIIFRRFIS